MIRFCTIHFLTISILNCVAKVQLVFKANFAEKRFERFFDIHFHHLHATGRNMVGY